MCGIAGIVNKKNKKVANSTIKAMTDLIRHRGPDDEGFYFSDKFAFGHRRLAILDLSSDAHQPMSYMGLYTITYNGEIYNYLELQKELKEEGYNFKSTSDTEVILAAYDKWGEDCVNKFNGMWAFALYDKKKNTIFCSRDRFGIKPFYYTEVNNQFIFGSEIKQLLYFKKEHYVNKDILSDYLFFALEEHTNETFFKGIFKLEQSHNLVYSLDNHTFTITKFYDLKYDYELNRLDEVQATEHLKQKMEASIDLRLRSDVKVGTCLSGGLDSSSIAAIASEKNRDKGIDGFTAIHGRSIDKKNDESHFAREVSKHCNFDLLEVTPSLEDITNTIEEVVRTQEEPFGGLSIFMQYFVMKKAKEAGCIVMLDGQGGDETLFGYEKYYSMYFAYLISQFKFFRYIKELIALSPFKTSKKKIIIDSIIKLFGNKLSFLGSRARRKHFNPKIEINRSRINYLYSFQSFKDFQKRELMLNNLPHLLRYEDKNSMKHSVEARLPFIDHHFVHTALSVNDNLKFKNGYLKYLLRKMINNTLPSSIVWRKNKFGFEAPADLWMQKNKTYMIKKIESSKIVSHFINIHPAIFNDRQLFWRLFNIAVWEKIYQIKFQ